MTHRTSFFLLLTVVLVPMCILPAWAVAEVDPADINPLADTLGWILAVPIARLCSAALIVLAFAASGSGRWEAGLFLVMLAGLIFLGPSLVKTVISHAAGLGGLGGP